MTTEKGTYRKAKPLHISIAENINIVRYTLITSQLAPNATLIPRFIPSQPGNQRANPSTHLTQHPLNIRPKHIARVRAPRRVRIRGDRRGRVPEDAGPLLDGLVVVLRVQRGVGGAVVDAHARARAGVPRVRRERRARPVLLGQVQLALRARAVPPVHRARVEARRRDAGVRDAGCEDVGVRGC